MSEPSETHTDQETWVAAYLQQHPDFFIRRPDILGNLNIPHETGEAVSLIEHQIRILRKQTDNYRKQLEELVAVARENDKLNRRLHRLTLAMIEAEDLQELLNTLQDELRTQFAADAVELKLFSVKELEAHAEEPGLAVFQDFMQTDKPSCGQLDTDKLESLFGSQAHETGSAALVPVRTSTLSGVLAIGSRDPHRFHQGKGLDFLIRLGELVSLTLQTVTTPGE